MKIQYFLITMISIGFNSYGQFGPQQVISSDAQVAGSVFSADIDGDGYEDVLSASRGGEGTLEWFKNDGMGGFYDSQLIGILYQTEWIRSADLDGDGDYDILSLSKFNNILVWFENMDGLGTFSSQKIIGTEVDLPLQIIAADIDGDGDQDVISASRYDNKIAWYENLDGLGSFGDQQIISNNANDAYSVFSTDIDGDEDLDVLAATPGSKRLYWYENLDGLGTFGSGNIIVETSEYGGFVSIFAIDIDNDGDQDVLSAEFGGDRIAWYENLNGNGSFGPQNVIDAELSKPREVFAIDLDGDGDNDVLAPSVPIGNISPIVWYENIDGQGTFGSQQIIVDNLNFARSVHAADLDNDGDIDVLSASQNDDTIAWYENYLVLGIGGNQMTPFAIYPNPVADVLNINSGDSLIDQILLYDNVGRKVLSEKNVLNDVSVSHLAAGFYFLKIFSGKIIQTEKIIIER